MKQSSKGFKNGHQICNSPICKPISLEWMLGDNLHGNWGVSKIVWVLTFDLSRRKQAWFASGCFRQEWAALPSPPSALPLSLSSPTPQFYLSLKGHPPSHTNYTEVHVVDVAQQRTLMFYWEKKQKNKITAYCLSHLRKGGKSEGGGIRSTWARMGSHSLFKENNLAASGRSGGWVGRFRLTVRTSWSSGLWSPGHCGSRPEWMPPESKTRASQDAEARWLRSHLQAIKGCCLMAVGLPKLLKGLAPDWKSDANCPSAAWHWWQLILLQSARWTQPKPIGSIPDCTRIVRPVLLARAQEYAGFHSAQYVTL